MLRYFNISFIRFVKAIRKMTIFFNTFFKQSFFMVKLRNTLWIMKHTFIILINFRKTHFRVSLNFLKITLNSNMRKIRPSTTNLHLFAFFSMNSELRMLLSLFVNQRKHGFHYVLIEKY